MQKVKTTKEMLFKYLEQVRLRGMEGSGKKIKRREIELIWNKNERKL